MVACESDAASVSTAVQAYNAQNSPNAIQWETTSGPGSITVGDPSTYGEGTQAKLLLASNYLNRWPSSSLYAISLATSKYGQAGDVIVYTAHTPSGLDWTTNAIGGHGPSACGAIATPV
jgi:hypothetical protein